MKILELYLYKMPAALQQFVPVACLMATLLVLTNMSRQNEVLALYSSGIGTIRLLSTFVAAVATISTVSFLSFDNLVPAFAKHLYEGPVTSIAVAIPGLVLPRLQQGLEIIDR